MGEIVYGDKVYGNKFGGDLVQGDKHVYGPGHVPDDGRHSGSRPHGGGVHRRESRVILLMTANPLRTSALRLDQERRAIDQVVTLAQAGDWLTVRTADAVRLDDLQTALLRHRPVIAHFSGHGSQSHGILVNDDFGLPQPVPPHALSDLFGILRGALRCVVLNACFTHEQARAVARHVPCVIAMQGPVPDQTAIRFATGFYQGIAHGSSVRVAYELGRNLLSLHGHDDTQLPVLVAGEGVAEQTVIAD
ncbi:CHAT domain-containing protein [Micromonospora echinofusca]|uniref:CHAT domain-containing protein n=1 Tax=Micromonospora echinofusca TaxID=47858 RepID=A0ABS3VT89_MICEH|nr:CHAT domain-containing protein [Micromonospora echinofusca]MBO4207658.1 CHAT domain-containing protein [Micromonospora echinofusca]